MQKKYDMEEWLINFASECINVAEHLPKMITRYHIASY